MKQWIDARHFEELAQAEPVRLCAAGRAARDAAGCYHIRVWDEEYILDGENHLVSVAPAADGATARGAAEAGMFSVFVIWYLLHPLAITPTGVWVSEKDFPGGVGFFRGPHQIPTASIATACGGDPARFIAACQKIGGKPIALADAACRFTITPDITIAVLLWRGDDDFPAEAKLLFEKSLIGQLPLDIVFCLAVEVCQRVAAAVR